MIEDRIKKLRDELNERNEEINILKGNTSKQINQIRGSITKFLDKVMEMGTLGERIKTLSKEQRITIVSILTAIGMAIGVLIGALLSVLVCPLLLHQVVPVVVMEKVVEVGGMDKKQIESSVTTTR